MRADWLEISGTVRDPGGHPAARVNVYLYREGLWLADGQTDEGGRFSLGLQRQAGRADLGASREGLGVWCDDLALDGPNITHLDLKLAPSLSIAGTLLMHDGATPHVNLPVQALRHGQPVATAFSDRGGQYRLENLKPGTYTVRCQVWGGCVYYQKTDLTDGPAPTLAVSSATTTAQPTPLGLKTARPLSHIDFNFAPFKKGTWRTFSAFDGLVHDRVFAVKLAADGTLWAATTGGVANFDGQRYQNYTRDNGLAHDWVNAVEQTDNGILWFGTGAGLNCWNGSAFKTYTTGNGLVGDWITGLAAGADNTLWVGTSEGLSRWDGETFTNYTVAEGLKAPWINDLAEAADGALWIGTTDGLCRWDGETFEDFPLPFRPYSDAILTLYVDGDNIMWAGTYGGLLRYDGQSWRLFTNIDGLRDTRVRCIAPSPDGGLWLLTNTHLSHFDGQHFVHFDEADHPMLSPASDLAGDGDGNLWLACEGGLLRYERCFVNYTVQDGLAGNRIWALDRDPDGGLWIGTHSGVSHFDGRRFANLTSRDGMIDNQVESIRWADGILWVGTYNGLARWDGKAWQNFTVQDGLPDNQIWALHPEADGDLWIGTGRGLCRWDGQIFQPLGADHGLPQVPVRALFRDDDNLWIGTNRGLFRWDGRTFHPFTAGDELEDEEFRALLRPPGGDLWIGTWSTIAVYDGHRLKSLAPAAGVSGYYIRGIHAGDDQVMWFATQGGVVRTDRTAWTLLHQRDGLAGRTTTALAPDSDGALWFGTEAGLSWYRANRAEPQVRIAALEVGDQVYGAPTDDPPQIPVGRHVVVRYNAIDYNPGKSLYRWRLSQRQPDWSAPTTQTTCAWTSDQTGTYTFEVQAIDRDFNYSAVARFDMQVVPDPYIQSLTEALSDRQGYGEFVGQSPSLHKVQNQLAEVARTEVTVLILGETGTGKGLAARALHGMSPRRQGPFIQVNCGALPAGLVESELFGHEKGAFTGAQQRKLGKVEVAGGGTLFLDEIGDLAPEAQTKLLQLLQERTFTRVGGVEALQARVRVAAATNRDLRKMVDEGRFREDLYYRLQVFPVQMPALRQRREDIPLLATYFMTEMATHLQKEVTHLTLEALEALQTYPWPGNVRELEHAVQRAVIVGTGPALDGADFSLGPTGPDGPAAEAAPLSLEENERRHIRQVLAHCRSIRRAAQQLGIPESTLRYRMKKLGIRPS